MSAPADVDQEHERTAPVERRTTTTDLIRMSEGEPADVVTCALNRGLSRRPDLHAEVMGDLTPAERDEVARACDRHTGRVGRIIGTTREAAATPAQGRVRAAGKP
ncbi:hypothetical protein ACFOWE_31135 [Planomonospora corallina]|uniref:Uncharacterized protein n=1 Tax=Planomonospora corallina TaxID=1806052 RepID=A0ABV8IIH3_9ACTN